MSRAKNQWVPATAEALTPDVLSPEQFIAIATRDGRNALGFVAKVANGHVVVRSADGLTSRAFPIHDSKIIELPTPRWDFAIKEPAFKF